jgi:hypothetical protein
MLKAPTRDATEAAPVDAVETMQHYEADQQLEAFVRESNRIEDIHRDPTPSSSAHAGSVGETVSVTISRLHNS